MRESLFQCALTGSERIAEDPRFSRALAELGNHRGEAKVLEELARRGEQLLLPAEERGTQILDLLALLDAVLLTQSKAAGSGDEVPLEEAVRKEEIPELYYRQESYRSLESLRLALTESGKGRMEVLKAARESKRPYLEDLRLQELFLRALSDRYTEFADEVENWILEERPKAFLPLLERAFSPEQKERVQLRYFSLIDAISGGGTKEYYLDIIARSQGDLKEAAIAALGEDPANYECLLALEKTEKNKAHAAVIGALVKYPQAEELVKQAFLKKPDRYIDAVSYSRLPYVADLIAGEMEKLYLACEKNGRDRKDTDKIATLWTAAIDMESPALLAQLQRSGTLAESRRDYYLLTAMLRVPFSAELRESLKALIPTIPMRNKRNRFSFLLALEELTPEESFRRFSPPFEERLLDKVLSSPEAAKERREDCEGIFEAVQSFSKRPEYGWAHLDPRWYPLLLTYKHYNENEGGLRALYREDIPRAKELWSAWEYRNVQYRPVTVEDIERLKAYAWTDFSKVFDGSIKTWQRRGFYNYDLTELSEQALSIGLPKDELIALLERVYKGVNMRSNNYGNATQRLGAAIQALKDGAEPAELTW
jgi:hypothetical protein